MTDVPDPPPQGKPGQPVSTTRSGRHYQASASSMASRAARARAAAGGAAGRWRSGRSPELHRCRLPDIERPRLSCDALIERAQRARHLADVHGLPGADAEVVAAAFVLVAKARTRGTWEREEP